MPVAFWSILYALDAPSGIAMQLTGGLATLFLDSTCKYATQGCRRQFIKSIFRQDISPTAIDQPL